MPAVAATAISPASALADVGISPAATAQVLLLGVPSAFYATF